MSDIHLRDQASEAAIPTSSIPINPTPTDILLPAITFKETPADRMDAVEDLYDDVFGPNRHEKASYRYRDGVSAVPGLDWMACQGDALVGVIRYWPVAIGPAHVPALLLGPLAVRPGLSGRGIGSTLVIRTLNLAARRNHRLVVLVGAPSYYRRFGFRPATPLGLVMPEETRPERLQIRSLNCDLAGRVSGAVHRWEPAPANVVPFTRYHGAGRAA